MFDAIVMSDIHLGSQTCNCESALAILKSVHDGRLPTSRLILNGDVFDDYDFRRLNKHHWKVLSAIRKVSDHVEVTWVVGNHDGPMDLISPLLGVTAVNELVLESGGKKFLVTHGDRYDDFIARFPFITWLGDRLYRLIQRMDGSQRIARFIKRRSKTYLRNSDKVRDKAIAEAAQRHLCGAVAGHTHRAEVTKVGNMVYANSGCFTETPAHFLCVSDGQITVHETDDISESKIHPSR